MDLVVKIPYFEGFNTFFLREKDEESQVSEIEIYFCHEIGG